MQFTDLPYEARAYYGHILNKCHDAFIDTINSRRSASARNRYKLAIESLSTLNQFLEACGIDYIDAIENQFDEIPPWFSL